MRIQPPFFPIIYIRGFAATMSEIENTVATPYMGFNLGSTKIRQNYEGKPTRFIFESPLIRLLKDYNYQETYHHGDLLDEQYVANLDDQKKKDLFRSIWVFRYYEEVSKELGNGKKERISHFAKRLREFIFRIRDILCETQKEKRNFKVYLVAHSMGGLIARCYLQNIMAGKKHYVDKVFTYATPHNGIDLLGINAPNLGFLDGLHLSNFNRKEMKQYLKLPLGSKDVNSLKNAFNPNRFFCFIGTNYKDYNAFFKLSKKASGEMSDGLVMMENAYVKGAPRAYAHRSHSGHYGIVNSEEGYQNLTRFLFGKIQVRVSLETNDITLPQNVYEQVVENGVARYERLKASYYIESNAMIRGEKYMVSERNLSQESAMRKEYDELLNKPLVLFTGFLMEPSQADTFDGKTCFAIRVGIHVPTYEIDRKFWFDAHFEGNYILWETVFISYDRNNEQSRLQYYKKSNQVEKNLPLVRQGTAKKPSIYAVPIGFDNSLPEHSRPAESFSGNLIFEINSWNNWH